jgi:hypothetical protein
MVVTRVVLWGLLTFVFDFTYLFFCWHIPFTYRRKVACIMSQHIVIIYDVYVVCGMSIRLFNTGEQVYISTTAVCFVMLYTYNYNCTDPCADVAITYKSTRI